MAVIRAFDVQATNLQRQGQLALWPPSFGQEAAQVGSARAARAAGPPLPVVPRARRRTIRGVDPIDIIRVMRGLTHGGWNPSDPKNGNTHIYTLVLGSQTLHATGLAMGLALRRHAAAPATRSATRPSSSTTATARPARATCTRRWCSPRATARPEVFFLQNNQWAISVPVATQSRSPLYKRGEGYGMPIDPVDGNDVLAS